MYPELQHFPVNWMDGMKISSRHFLLEERALSDRLRDLRSYFLTDYNYGLLPGADGRACLRFEDIDTINHKLTLLKCRAITRGGMRIEITPALITALALPDELRSCTYDPNVEKADIIIVVNPDKRRQVGEFLDAHHPFHIPDFQLSTIPSTENTRPPGDPSYLCIGKLIMTNGIASISEDYVPPSAFISSHAALKNRYESYFDRLGGLVSNVSSVIQIAHNLGAKNTFGRDVKQLTEKLLFFLADIYDYYRLFLEQSSPVQLYYICTRMARNMKLSLDLMDDAESVKVFFNKILHGNGAPDFDMILDGMIDFEYVHEQLAELLAQLDLFVIGICNLFDYLKSNGINPGAGPVVKRRGGWF